MEDVRSLLLAILVVSGCVESAEEPAPAARIEITSTTAELVETEVDLCALASELASDNVCSLICDPDAMADFLLAGGMTGGKCVQLRCELPGVPTVLVGVCLPP